MAQCVAILFSARLVLPPARGVARSNSAMSQTNHDCQTCAGRQYVALLDVSEAIVLHRDLPSLFHDLAGRLRQGAEFDFLSLVLSDPPTTPMASHVGEPCAPPEAVAMFVLPTRDDPAGLVWQSQQPLVTSHRQDL